MCFVVNVLGKAVYFFSPLPLGKSRLAVMIPLSPILIPEIVPASKPHLLKLAFPGSCIARIIGQRGRVINHIKETFKCTIFSANQGVYVSGLESSQARLFKIGAKSFTRLIESVDEVLRVTSLHASNNSFQG